MALLLGACSYSDTYGPVTEPAEVGVEAELIVATDCGLDNMVFDHDGSLWVPAAIDDRERHGTPDGFETDNDSGAIVLVSEDEAEYRSSLGRVIELTRLEGNLVTSGC